MPLYHSTALFLAVFASWHAGSTVAIGRKFSATKFWDEVRAANATVVQYVGEVCRYLLAVPPSKNDKNHRVRMACALHAYVYRLTPSDGNGMRPDVWEKFRERFGVRTISEVRSMEASGADDFSSSRRPRATSVSSTRSTFVSSVTAADAAAPDRSALEPSGLAASSTSSAGAMRRRSSASTSSRRSRRATPRASASSADRARVAS